MPQAGLGFRVYRVILGYWGYIGILGLYWDIGVILGYWGYIGILGSYWDIGVILCCYILGFL